MTKPEKRRAVPMKVQRDVALRQLAELMRKQGFEVGRFELDHDPAIGLRAVDEKTGQHVPHQHDPSFLVWLPKETHRVKTSGSGATTRGSDQGEIARLRRLEAQTQENRRKALAKAEGAEENRKTKSKWPKRPFPKRPKQPKPKR